MARDSTFNIGKHINDTFTHVLVPKILGVTPQVDAEIHTPRSNKHIVGTCRAISDDYLRAICLAGFVAHSSGLPSYPACTRFIELEEHTRLAAGNPRHCLRQRLSCIKLTNTLRTQ